MRKPIVEFEKIEFNLAELSYNISMKNLITSFLKNPADQADLLRRESQALKIVSIVFFFTSLFIFSVVFKSIGAFSKIYMLSLLLLLNGISYLIFSYLCYKSSKKTLSIKSITDLEISKKTFYFRYIFIIGIPYLLLAVWMIIDLDYKSVLEMFLIFLGVILFVFIFDWKKFVNSKERYSTFFEC